MRPACTARLRSAAIPSPLAADEGTLYTKLNSSVSSLWYTPDNSTNEYQLTRTISASYTLFGTNTTYVAGLQGGWTFLPGGLLLQYGFMASPVNNSVIQFPVPFTTLTGPFSITLGAVRPDTTDKMISIKNGSVSNTQYLLILSGSNLPSGIFWTAVGV